MPTTLASGSLKPSCSSLDSPVSPVSRSVPKYLQALVLTEMRLQLFVVLNSMVDASVEKERLVSHIVDVPTTVLS